MPYFLLTLLVFLSPFIINPFFGAFFEPPKVLVVQILIELLLVFILLKDKSFFKTLDKYQVLFSAVLIALTLYHLFLIKTPLIFFGNEVRLQGIFLLWHLLILAILGSKLAIGKLPQMLFPISLIFLLITAILVEPDINGRAIGTLGEANALASSAIFFWPFAISLNLKRKWKNNLLTVGLLLSTLVIILFSGSRSGMLAFAFQLIFLVSARYLKLKKAVIFIVIFMILSMLLPFIKGGGWYENRSEVWKTALTAGLEKPLGWGFGNIEQGLYQTSLKLNNNLQYQAFDSSHNLLLDFWVQGGVIGFVLILGMISLSLYGLVKKFRLVEIATLLGLIAVLLFNPASVATLVAFWFILGQGFRGSSEVDI